MKHLFSQGRNWPFLLVFLAVFAIAACGGNGSGPEPAMEQVRADTAAVQQHTCPMHPQFVSNDPDVPCPICGMDLVPVSGGPATATGSSPEVRVAPEMIQTMGVRTARVDTAFFERTVRAFGNVESDERLETVAVSRLEGWIEDLAVRAEGDEVTRGALPGGAGSRP